MKDTQQGIYSNGNVLSFHDMKLKESVKYWNIFFSKTVDTRIVSDKTFTALEFSSRYLSGFLNFTSVPVFYVCTIGLPATKVTVIHVVHLQQPKRQVESEISRLPCMLAQQQIWLKGF